MDSIFISAIRDFDRILLQPNCLHSILDLRLKSMMNYQLSESTVRYLHNAYYTKLYVRLRDKIDPSRVWILRLFSNEEEVNEIPAKNTEYKDKKMVRIRRKSAVRKTVDCFRRCLNSKACPHVLKWVDRKKETFSILYKHKKSPEWSSNYLALFKELDSISKSKYEKYKKEHDFDQAGKRRCKANLRKLCQDGLLEYITENQIDKCTREVHYKFTEAPSDDIKIIKVLNKKAKRPKTEENPPIPQNPFQMNPSTFGMGMNFGLGRFENEIHTHSSEQPSFIMENNWMNQPLISNDNFICSSNSETEHETKPTSYTFENGNMWNMHLALQPSNTSTGNNEFKEESEQKNVNNFYSISQNKSVNDINMEHDVYYDEENGYYYLLPAAPDGNIAFNCSLSSSCCNMDSKPIIKENQDMNFISYPSSNMDVMPAMEPSQDKNGLMMTVMEECQDIYDLLTMLDDKKIEEAYDKLPLLSEGCTPSIKGMNINEVAETL